MASDNVYGLGLLSIIVGYWQGIYSFGLLLVNERQYRIKTRCGITSVSLDLAYHFPDLYHIHENSAETLGP